MNIAPTPYILDFLITYIHYVPLSKLSTQIIRIKYIEYCIRIFNTYLCVSEFDKRHHYIFFF